MSFGGYGSGAYGTPTYGGVSNLDARMFEEIEYHMLENGDADAVFDAGAFGSGMWTQDEILGYIADRRRVFQKLTGAVLTHTAGANAIIPQQARYDYPSDWIETKRVSVRNADDSEIRVAPRLDAFQADAAASAWQGESAAFPYGYHDLSSTLPTLKFELVPAPNTPGNIDLLYVAQPDLTANIISSFSWIIKYGVMSDMLSKDGEAHDPERAEYCETRWEQGIELVRLLMGGRQNA